MARLLPELRLLAHKLMQSERADHTWTTNDLVNETIIEQFLDRNIPFENRAHLFGSVLRHMRRLLAAHGRSRRSLKRGGRWNRVELTLDRHPIENNLERLIAISEAIDKLETTEPRLARAFELHYFFGFSQQETARLLGVSERTARKDWNLALSFLAELMDQPDERSSS